MSEMNSSVHRANRVRPVPVPCRRSDQLIELGHPGIGLVQFDVVASGFGCVVKDEMRSVRGRGTKGFGKAVLDAPPLGNVEIGYEVRHVMDAAMTVEQSTVIAEQLDHQRAPLPERGRVVKLCRLPTEPHVVYSDVIEHEERSGAVRGGPLLGGLPDIVDRIGDLDRRAEWIHGEMSTHDAWRAQATGARTDRSGPSSRPSTGIRPAHTRKVLCHSPAMATFSPPTSTATSAGRRPSLRFLGAVRTVTGSKFLLRTPESSVLIDCGMFQGPKELRLRNRAELPFKAASLDAVVITHAHIDHLGLLPALTRNGLRAPVHMTPGSAALAAVVLPDSGRLQEEEASHANRVGSSRHQPALPLFTEEDGLRSLESIVASPFGTPVRVTDDVTVTFRRSGHILGSAWVLVDIAGFGAIAVSGDIGRPSHPLLLPPEPLSAVETLLVESTYGDRLHDLEGSVERLGEAVARTAARGGSVIIPSFAVDRTEVLLIHLRELMRSGAIPELPVFVDSPMALDALRAYRQAITERWPEIRPDAIASGDPFDTGHLRECRTVAESKEIANQRQPSIIVSASGMATGGRVLHHLADRLPDPRDTVILPGFQVPGTRGAQLAGGAREVKIFGEYIDVRAEIVSLEGFSVHADRGELIDWLATAPSPPRTCFVVHGEAESSDTLATAIRRELGWRAIVPVQDELVLLGNRPRVAAAI